MAAKLLDDLIRTGFNHHEPFLVINGRPGVGKSTLLANLPDHLIFNYDLGLGELNARSVDMSEQTFEDQLSLLEQVSQKQGDIKWVCFDSADKMEVKIQESVCRDHGWSSMFPMYVGMNRTR